MRGGVVTAACVAVLGATACEAPGLSPADGGPTPSAALVLAFDVTPAATAWLEIDSGEVELRRLGLFGDVATDQRTMVDRVELDLPSDHAELSFSAAPYGLYSRVRGTLDDVYIQGSWRGTPLDVVLQIETAPVDLRGPSLDYEPGQHAIFTVHIDSAAWFTDVDLDSARVDNGRIRIDGFHNSYLAQVMTSAICKSFSLAPPPSSSPAP